MKSLWSWKLVPLAAVVALGLLIGWPGGSYSPDPVRAAALSITPGDTTIASGDSTSLSATLDTTGSPTNDIVFSTTGVLGTTTVTIHITSCQPSCSSGRVINDSDHPSITTDNVTSITGTLTVDCTTDDIFNVRVEQTGSSDRQSVAVTCQASTDNITITKVATGGTASDTFAFNLVGPGSACDKSFSLANAGSQSYPCTTSGTYTVAEAAPPAGWTLTAIDCTASGGIAVGDLTITVSTRTVIIPISDPGNTVSCTFTNTKAGGTTATITASAGPNSVGCSGSSFISLVLKDANNQPVADGTTVTVTASIGSVNPTSATTTAGGALILFTAPAASGGTATITATAGTATGSATVAVSCAGAAPTATPAPAATVAPSVIKAPSTGDAGLASSGGASLPAGIGLALIVSALLGGLVAMRVRA